MSLQALLTGADGIPVSDGAYALTFRFYDTDTGGLPLWEETQQVEVAGGLFHAILGSATPLTLAFDQPYWVGVTIGQEEEMAPSPGLNLIGLQPHGPRHRGRAGERPGLRRARRQRWHGPCASS